MDKNKQFQGTKQAKGKFLADMSFEFQDSMKAVLAHCSLMRETELSVKQVECADAIRDGVLKISWIVNDMLDFSQLELGKVELQSIDFNLEYLINDILKKTVEQKQDHPPVDTYIDIAKDVPRDLMGDPTRLRQVLVNLFENAFKVTLKGGIGIIVKNIGAKATGSTSKNEKVNLQIIVKDGGKGIPQDQLESIFVLDSQEGASKSREYGGAGLRLAICKLVVDAMDGTITVESEEGRGSSFIVELDFAKGASLRGQEIFPLSRDELIGKKVIIVDDNEIARKILKTCCETMGIELVLISASPKAVLRMLDNLSGEEEVPDLMLCDVMLSEMGGHKMVQKIRAKDKYKNIKIIAVTSAVHVGSARSAQESGFDGFLPKPVFLDELAKIITTVLGDKRENKTIVTRHMAEALKLKGTKVLIIEDQGPDQKLIEECLNMMGCEQEFVPSGQEAIECLKERLYDLCLLDFRKYQEEGAEIVRTIKEISQNMPTIVFMTSDMEKHQRDCLDAGIDVFIIKSVDNMAGLKEIIERYGKN